MKYNIHVPLECRWAFLSPEGILRNSKFPQGMQIMSHQGLIKKTHLVISNLESHLDTLRNLAVVKAISHYVYLISHPFTMVTDHKDLQYLNRSCHLNSCLRVCVWGRICNLNHTFHTTHYKSLNNNYREKIQSAAAMSPDIVTKQHSMMNASCFIFILTKISG